VRGNGFDTEFVKSCLLEQGERAANNCLASFLTARTTGAARDNGNGGRVPRHVLLQ